MRLPAHRRDRRGQWAFQGCDLQCTKGRKWAAGAGDAASTDAGDLPWQLVARAVTHFPLDQATVIHQPNGGRHVVDAAPEYWNLQSGFGGWALATALAAVRHIHGETRPLASMSATFLKPLTAQRYLVTARELRKGRTASFYRVEFADEAKADECVFASDCVLSSGKASPISFVAPFPHVTPWQDAPVLPTSPGPRWLSQYEQRVARGTPFTRQESPSSAMWLRDASERAWDEKALIAASDTPMPRSFFLDTTPRFGATVTYNLHIIATPDDIDQLGQNAILVAADSPAVRMGRFSQDTQLWSAEGHLLAVSNQLSFF